jgi:hypothetical protein
MDMVGGNSTCWDVFLHKTTIIRAGLYKGWAIFVTQNINVLRNCYAKHKNDC